MKKRALILAPFALLAAVLVVRIAMVAVLASQDPARAASAWPGHPDVILASGLDEVGRVAATGGQIDRGLVDRLVATNRKTPLAPEPFLVRGVDAQLRGDDALAGRAFLEARRRDPRSFASRYFLADYFLRTGQVQPGLEEISVLARLVPASRDRIAPYLAAFARAPGAAPNVKAVLRDHPELEPLLMRSLTDDVDNADLIMSLWSGRTDAGSRGWQERLVRKLVATGQFAGAKSAWARFAGRSGDVPLDPPFDDKRTPPPFGWTLVSGPEGFAEVTGEGQLHLLHYGRENLVLANRLLVLRPGRYRLAMRVTGAGAAAKRLSWSISCLPSKLEVAAFDLRPGPGGTVVRSFLVPPTCPAQQFELSANAPEFPEQADVTIDSFSLRPEAGR